VRLSAASQLSCVVAVVLVACAGAPPVVEHRTYEKDLVSGALAKVAVVPFYPTPDFDHSGKASVSASEASDLVARFVTEELEARGIPIVAPNDLVIAFEGQGRAIPRQDPTTLAALAKQQFGATAVLLGTVRRYREREGAAAGALHPASVRFELDLYLAPTGERIWTARFDETQIALGEDVLRARRYPSFGTRWLSAAELTRWGAEHAVDALPEIRP